MLPAANRKAGSMAATGGNEAVEYSNNSSRITWGDQTQAEPMPSMVAYLPPPSAGKPDPLSEDNGLFARGGNGIFGEPMASIVK